MLPRSMPVLLLCWFIGATAVADKPFPAHRVVGNVYYVGSDELATYLITTPEGHLLINSGFDETVPMIRGSVESLGFKMTDIKILLASHAHSDHVAGHERLRQLTGAKVFVMRGDQTVIAEGGRGQYLYNDSRWTPCPVDRVLEDGDEVKLGDTTLVAHRTSGHTRGCTTWAWQATEGDQKYRVVVIGSPNVNPGYLLVGNQEYPEIADDFAKTFAILKKLPCDVFLGAHGNYYGMHAKHGRLAKADANPFIDPQGYQAYVADREQTYKAKLAEQAAVFPGKQSEWHGFTRFDFEVNGKAVLVVAPVQPAEGKPWVWHGEFFGHKPEPDIALLKRGFHIVYLRVPDMLGAPAAVTQWNALYKELTEKHGLAKQAALVGLSRGGLYCYNWAAANPDKVACIYGDAPVCDFKSWPGGRGKGKGSPQDWKLVLEKYGFKNEAEALAYAKNPVDNLAPLAAAKVPLLHVYGDADDVVPWDENTGVVAERYRQLGGSIMLIAKPGVGHHPHGLDDPTPIVEFIARHAAIGERPADAKSTSLFNGTDLTGWHVDVPERDTNPDAKATFIVRDGKLVSLGQPAGHLITDAKYENYRLAVEYRFSGTPGNCGVLVHASTPRMLYKMFPKSIEVQMNHSHAGDFWCIGEDITVPDMVKRRGPQENWGVTEGKGRRILNLTDDSENPPGKWNTLVIECVKDEVKVWVNGDLVNHGTKCTASKGQIALQAEGSEVEFRKLELTPITKLTE